MCGIAGVLCLTNRTPPGVEQLRRMAGALRHRGPDEAGVYRDARVGLAHTRLSIIDIGGGQQPLGVGNSWIAFNGEIFNHVELRQELESLGRVFRTRSDTEVIVQAYAVWGHECVQRFNGQWAFALWDGDRETLVLSRDTFGILPLYWAEHRGRLFFASEVKALFAGAPDLTRELDPVGLDETFTFWSVVPPQSVFVGVNELEPGCTRIYQPKGVQQFDHAAQSRAKPRGTFGGSLEEATEAVSAALKEATRLRLLRSDVPVGSYLSGGLDSSLVAALGHSIKDEGFSTFSLRFSDSDFDEGVYQKAMADRVGGEHHEVWISSQDIVDTFPKVLRHTERPILRTAPVPLFILSQKVRASGVKVVLTGEGADEMFAGYDLFREAKIRRFWARQPSSRLRPLLLERLYPYLRRSPVGLKATREQFFGRGLGFASLPGFSHQLRWQTTSSLKRLLSGATRETVRESPIQRLLGKLPHEFTRWTLQAQDQYLEVRTLLSAYLLSSQGDRMLMGHSVEGRFPFLDPNVVALADSLPDSYKLRVLDEKHVLKRVGRGLVPEGILERKKQPYRAPDALAFIQAGRTDWIEDALSEHAVAKAGVFDVMGVRQLWRKCQERASQGVLSNMDNMALVGVLSTQLLHQQFVAVAPYGASEVSLTTLVDRLGKEGQEDARQRYPLAS